MNIDESISITITSLKTALSEVTVGDDVPDIFTEEKVLARPPFTYIHALVKFFGRRKPSSLGCWKKLLFDDNGDDDTSYQLLSRKDKLTFLSRLLAIVSRVSGGRRLDVLVSPSKVLCGQDVLATHELLRALARSVKSSEEEMTEAVRYVSEEGDANLYKRGVRTRKAFVVLQAIVRGWLVRSKYHLRNKATINPRGRKKGDSSDSNNMEDSESPKSKKGTKSNKQKTKVTDEHQTLVESYEAVLSRKADVEEQIKVAEGRLKRENDKLIRMLNLGVHHKTQTHDVVPYAGLSRPPLSAPNIGRTANAPFSKSHNIDPAFAETITNFSERQKHIKQKERRIDERESKVKQRFARSKHKEAELKIQEERISDLAGKIRKQQAQLKEQRLQFERAKALGEMTADEPPETSRPCLMCTERKTQLRDIRSKVRQRTRALDQREAVVVGRAKELRRRERDLVKRERIIAELAEQQQESSAAAAIDDYLAFSSGHDDDERPREKQRRRQNDSREPRAAKKPLPDVRDASGRPAANTQRREKRKRRQGSRPQEERPCTPKDNDMERSSSMSASFGEGQIPTIEEETHAEDEEDEQEERNKPEEVGDQEAEKTHDAVMENGEYGSEFEEKMRSTETPDNSIVPTDIRKARESLGIAKSKRKQSQRQSTINVKQKEKDDEPRIIMHSPSPKKRHVFTFEKKEVQQQGTSLHSSGGRNTVIVPNTGERIQTPSRERDRRPRPQHDDWISSFDVQMKCAMNRLKELV